MDTDISKKILWAYFEGKATLAQKQLLLEWLKDPPNRDVFYEVLHEWEKAHPQILPDPRADWERMMLRLDMTPETVAAASSKTGYTRNKRGLSGYWWIAASVLLLVVGWVQRDLFLYKTYSSAFGETRTFHLPDGSRVMLNADSRLVYPRFEWLQPVREARLWGEAEFSVVHTEDHRPFLVRTPDQLEVRVLGTEFTVYSREEQSRVILTKGKVRLRSLKTDNPPLDVRPGEVVTVNRKGALLVKEQEEIASHLAWREHRFVFNRTPLADIAVQIRERFGVELVITDTLLAGTQLTGNYPAEDAGEVIAMLTRLLNVRSKKLENKKILLTNN